jgi:multiple sugar transport system ATP-binding protein
MNFVEGVISNGHFKGKDVTVNLSTYLFRKNMNGALKATLGIRPEHVFVGDEAKRAPFSKEVVINTVEPMGSNVLCYALFNDQDFKFLVNADLGTKVNDKLTIGFDPAKASCFDKTTEERL